MVSAIADVSRADQVNLFRRFELMKGWHEVENISFDRIVDPGDNTRLHDSDWTTRRLTEVLANLILALARMVVHTRRCTGTALATAPFSVWHDPG
jgi:hypothetical protein